jgi:type VI secretion system protein ImpH
VAGAYRSAPDNLTAAPNGEPDREAWLERARRAGFRALMRLVERFYPGTSRVGEGGPAELEPVRFHHDPSLAFSNADVVSVVAEDVPALDTPEHSGSRYHITTTFLGLSGGVSPLPDHFADELAAEDADAPSRARFLDLFHHRVLSLLYRGVARLDHPGEFEGGGADSWSRRVLCLLGADGFAGDAPPAELRAAVEDELLSDLGPAATVGIREFIGSWIDLEPDDRARLDGRSMCLGRNVILGRRIFDLTGKFRVQLGPVSYETMQRLLTGGDLNRRLHEIVKLVTSRPEECEAEVTVAADQAPGLRLTREARQGLGRATWLGRRSGEKKQVVVELAG